MSIGPGEVGSSVANLQLRDDDGRARPLNDALGRPLIVAFVDDSIRPVEDDVLRAHLRGLGASLLRVGRRSLVWIGPDDRPAAMSVDGVATGAEDAVLRGHFGVPSAAALAVLLIDGQ